MKLITIILFVLSLSAQACGDEEHKAVPFALQLEEYSKSEFDLYRVLVPKKNGEYYLTTMMVEAKGTMMTQLETHERNDYEEFYTAFLWIDESLIDKLIVHLKYSTKENGAFLACGEFVPHDFSKLLKAGLNK